MTDPSDRSVVPRAAGGSYPARGGNVVLPLVDGEPAFREICRAVERARVSVWVTVTFLWPAFRMPEDRGTFFDVLDAAAALGIDVRVVFWRPDAATSSLQTNAFWGSPDQMASLEARGSLVKVRWDRAQQGCAQHQKSWVIDAGTDGEVAFVGGINKNPRSMVAPGHAGAGENHDVYAKLQGPAVVDVHHNFVQRWNEASERLEDDGTWGHGADQDLPFPSATGAPLGTSTVQVQRTIAKGRYADGRSTPGGTTFDIAGGERSILDHYLLAIGSAGSSIYIENQSLEDARIVAALQLALDRGVQIAVVLPGEPEISAKAKRSAGRADFVQARSRLADHPNFTAVGLAGLDDQGRRHHVYVHAKLMLVDDAWGTIGSANLHWFSLFGNAEMNISFWDPDVVSALRCQLLQEHLAIDTRDLTGHAALSVLGDAAERNRESWDRGTTDWPGNAFRIDLTTYGD